MNAPTAAPGAATTMYHQRLANEFLMALSRRAIRIIAPALREEEQRDAYDEFFAAFKEELLRYEQTRERMQARLAGRSEVSVQAGDRVEPAEPSS